MDSLSVVIITRDEGEDIRQCLESVKWADEVVVVDSFSKDKTVEICREYGSKILQMKWEGYARNKNRGIEEAKGKWILSLDADERVSPELAGEIKKVLREDSRYGGYRIPMKFFFLGHWMRHGGLYPKHHLRLFKKEAGRFEIRAVHEGVKVEGEVASLKAPMLHYSYNNLSDYFRKFNRYSTLDALEKAEGKSYKGKWYPFLRLPTEFILTYFIKQGFRDGFPGFLYSSLNAFYVFVKYVKVWEEKNRKNKARWGE